jgi:hypothetical protein
VVEVGGQTFSTPGVDLPIQPNSQQAQLIVRRVSDAAPGTARLAVTDACGDWPTFVGGGLAGWGVGTGSPSTPLQETPPTRRLTPGRVVPVRINNAD